MDKLDIFSRLFSILNQRKAGGNPETSYVAKLLARGTGKINRKVMEEAYELCEAALKGDRAQVTAEICDLLFHAFVLAVDQGVSLEAVREELERRFGTSGLEEKARRKTT